jgi:hypothetical protein
MVNLDIYDKNKYLCRRGDVFVFRADWLLNLLSGAIEALAPTESHTAICNDPATATTEVVAAQSTRPIILRTGSLDGVQFTPMPTILREYSHGSAACLRLSDASRARMDWGVFGAFVNECVGTVKYDTAGLFEYLLRDIPVLGAHVAPEEKTNEMYCCAFVIASLTKGGLLNGVRPTPR